MKTITRMFLACFSTMSLAWGANPSLATLSVPVDCFERTNAAADWTFQNGGNTGASGSFTQNTNSTRSGKVGQLAFDFSAGGIFVAAQKNLTKPILAPTLRMVMRGGFSVNIKVRVIDLSNQTLQYGLSRPITATAETGWYVQTLRLDGVPETAWGGPADGKIHGAIKSVSILAEPKRYNHDTRTNIISVTAGSIWFDDIFFEDVLPPSTFTSVENFESSPASLAPWTFSPGDPTPASGSVSSTTQGFVGKGALLSYDLSVQGNYIMAVRAMSPALNSPFLIFWAKAPLNAQVRLRAVDGSGEIFQYQPPRPTWASAPDDWFPLVVNFADPVSHWGGDKSGRLEGGATALQILVDPPRRCRGVGGGG